MKLSSGPNLFHEEATMEPITPKERSSMEIKDSSGPLRTTQNSRIAYLKDHMPEYMLNVETDNVV